MSFHEETTGDIQILKEVFIEKPLEMEKCNDYLYVSDFRGDSLLWCYNINKLDEPKRMLPWGEGPNEFLSPIQYFITDTSLIVHNRWHYSAQKFRYLSRNLFIISSESRFKLSTDIDMIYPVSDNKYIASGRFNDCRFIVTDNKGNIISKCGSYPSFVKGEEAIPNFPKFMFHQSMFGYNSQKNLLTSVTGHVLDIWKFDNDTLILKNRVLLSPYEYKYKEGKEWASAVPEEWVEIGSKRVYSTENNIYILYNPNTEEMKYRQKDKLNSEIWIFDWDGIPIKKIRVNKKIICFCVDEGAHSIYCITNAPEPSIGLLHI